MTAPSLRALGTVTSGNSLNPSFAAPAGSAATDVIVIIAFVDDGRTTVGTLPSGFATVPGTPQRNAAAGAPNHNLMAWWGRFSDVGAGPWVVPLVNGFATPFVEGRAAAVQGCVTTGSPWDATNGATSGSTSQSPAPLVSATSTGADRYALYAATNWNGGAWTPPTGWTEQWDANTRIVTIDDLGLPTAQTVSPQAVCAGTNLMNAWVGILLPAGPTLVSVTEAGSAADSTAVSGTAPIADTGGVADTVAASATTPLTDFGSTVDSMAATTSTALADAAASSDALSALVSLAQADAGMALDALAPTATVPLVDGGTAVDSLAVTAGGATLKFVTDRGTAAECIDATLMRPTTGSTSRPATGTTPRPNTGITC